MFAIAGAVETIRSLGKAGSIKRTASGDAATFAPSRHDRAMIQTDDEPEAARDCFVEHEISSKGEVVGAVKSAGCAD